MWINKVEIDSLRTGEIRCLERTSNYKAIQYPDVGRFFLLLQPPVNQTLKISSKKASAPSASQHEGLKGHGNEPNFPNFLHKSLWPRSLTLHFEPFRFWLRIRGDIRIRKMTPRIGESGSRQDCL